jgi:23S rRNA (adenine2503-C2)-methyltransferase
MNLSKVIFPHCHVKHNDLISIIIVCFDIPGNQKPPQMHRRAQKPITILDADTTTPMIIQTEKPDITEFSRSQLADWFEAEGMRAFRADQVMRWIYGRKIASFEAMTNIARPVRDKLERHFSMGQLTMVDDRLAPDGTRKFSFALKDNNHIESVLIGEKDHHTLCISTQAGCAMGCAFCMTARNGLSRNLTPGEIIGQVLSAQRICALNQAGDAAKPLTNIVLMGMGEPLANYDNVMQALDVITDAENGLSFASRRITLSTAGIVPKIASLGKNRKFKLAVSLNAPDNETRNRLMPINRTYPLERLLEACKAYDLVHRDRITFEYVLIKNVNDSPEHARKLAKLLAPIRGKINLIPYNPHEGSEFLRPDVAAIEAFHSILINKHYTTMIRWSKGDDISAACGQLAGRSHLKS